jgi:hypothetical protein
LEGGAFFAGASFAGSFLATSFLAGACFCVDPCLVFPRVALFGADLARAGLFFSAGFFGSLLDAAACDAGFLVLLFAAMVAISAPVVSPTATGTTTGNPRRRRAWATLDVESKVGGPSASTLALRERGREGRAVGLLGGRDEPDPWPEIREALRDFASQAVPEPKFKPMLEAHLRRTFPSATVKPEAGVDGTGTKVDLHVVHRDTVFVISIKRGLGEQKVKTVLGEFHIVLGKPPPNLERDDIWWGGKKGKPKYLILYVFDQKAGSMQYLELFEDNAKRMLAHHPGFRIEAVSARGGG